MRHIVALMVVLAGAVVAGESPFPPGFGAPKRAREEWREKITAALAKKIDVDLDKKPLDQAIAFFKEQSGVNFVVDPSASGLKPMPVVTLKSKGAVLETALREALKAGALDFQVRDGVVFVFDPKKVDAEMLKSEDMMIARMLEGRPEMLDFQPKAQPAGEMLQQLTEPAGIKMSMDPALAKTPITLELKEAKLGHAIRWLVRYSGGKIEVTKDGMSVVKRPAPK